MSERGNYAKGIEKRRLILEKALEVIARDGYSQTSLAEIAREVGISQAAVLYYFGSKEEMFTQVLRERDQRVTAAVLGSDLADESQTASIDTFRSLPDVVRANESVPGLIQLYSRLLAEGTDRGHAAHEYFRERYSAFLSQAARDIKSHQANGDVRADIDADATAAMMIALADGLQTMWLLGLDVDMPSILDEFVRALSPHDRN